MKNIAYGWMLQHVRYHRFSLYLLYNHRLYISSRVFSYVYYRLTNAERKQMDKLCKKVTI